MNIKVIDLFCGAGGLTRGLLDAGLDVRLGIDIDAECRYAYEANNHGAKFLLSDIAKIDTSHITKAWEGADIRVLAGCAPCQAFSTYTNGIVWNTNNRWKMLRAFGKIVRECQPDIVTMENVSTLSRHKVFNEFCDTLEGEGFKVAWDILDCRKYGIPQSRKRLVLIASKFGLPNLPTPTNLNIDSWKTVRESISSLKPINAGESDSKDPIHFSSGLTDINLKRIKASVPGGTWRDWPKPLVAKCHRRKSGKTYASVYGRMEWDSPSPTITGQCYGFGNGRFGHPEQDRAISLREAAILQTFPKDYSFVPPQEEVILQNVGQMIGNAVPPRLGKVIGIAISQHVRSLKPNYFRDVLESSLKFVWPF